MSVPQVTFSIEPEENGKLVYLPVASINDSSEAASMVAFRLRVRNNDDQRARLNKISVSFPGHPGLTKTFNRDVAFSVNQTRTIYLKSTESIHLGATPPGHIRIGLFFDGHNQPKEIQRMLAPHTSPTPQKSYRFPAKAKDMEFDEYFTQKSRHSGGSQHFGYDISNYGWNADERKFASYRAGTTGKKNEDHFGWNQPLHAVADGIVLRSTGDYPDNPKPGKRAVMPLGEHIGETVTAVDSCSMSNKRCLATMRTESGTLKLIVFEYSGDAKALTRKGEAEAQAIQSVSVAALNSSRAVTAARTAAGQLALTLWRVSANGQAISALDTVNAGSGKAVKVLKLTTSRVALAIRTNAGRLSILIFDIQGNQFSNTPVGNAAAGTIGPYAITAPRPERLVTAVQTASGNQKVILWHIADDGSVTRGKSALQGKITDVSAISLNPKNRFATGVRTDTGRFKLFFWEIDASNEVIMLASTQAGKVTEQSLSLFKKGTVASAVRTRSGNLKMIIWSLKSNNTIKRTGEKSAGKADLISLADKRSRNSTAPTVARRHDGKLMVTLWQLARGNGFWILHDDEIVIYAHMRQGSLNPALMAPKTQVKQGQWLGNMGNAGPSSGPHLHMHAIQAPSGLSMDELIEKTANGTLKNISSVAYRPLPFHGAQAMKLSDVRPGMSSDNPFAKVDDQGFYFERMAIWPGMTTPGIPTGRAEIAFHGVRASAYQALFDAVTGANYGLIWFNGYTVRNGQNSDLRFNVIFRPNPNRPWAANHNLTSQQYQQLVTQRKAQGFRPVNVNSYTIGNQIRYAVIFEKSNSVAWEAYHGRTAQQHQERFDDLQTKGFAPINVSVVFINGQRRYTALYEKRSVGGFVLKSFLTPAQYQTHFDQHLAEGFQVAYLDAYGHNGDMHFSAIWNREHQGAFHARHHLSSGQYQQVYETKTAQGFLTQVVAGYEHNNQHRFAGVWQK